MSKFSNAFVLFSLALFYSQVNAAPAPSPDNSPGTFTSSSTAPSSTTILASDDPNDVLWSTDTDITPEPVRGTLGAPLLGPQNVPIDRQNPDLLAPPSTDAGSVSNAKWPMSLSHNRLQTGGWARQQNVDVMPIATGLAGVNMRLEAGAIRELHWHTAAEWAYVIKGTTQVTSVDQLGRNYIANVGPGDLWYFPPGIPHSLQGTSDNSEGTEFLLVFPDGNFSEDETFLLTDWLAHVPKSVLAKNFKTSISAFDKLPGQQLYIFPGVPPPDDQQDPMSPAGIVPNPFSFAFSNVTATLYEGGTVKVADSTTFKVSTIAVAEITVEPGAIRELHWHPTQDEWGFFLEGSARMTLFAANGNARTFDYEPGDVSYTPAPFGHYVENIGNTTLKFLEIFNTAVYQDVSLAQWLALTPPELVKAHLGFDDQTIALLNKTKPVVV